MKKPTDSHHRAMKIVSDLQDDIAGLARDGYRDCGRGVVQVEVPQVPSGGSVMREVTLKYHALEDFCDIAAERPTDDGTAKVFLALVESYDPAKQAVIIAAIEGEPMITLTMQLDGTLISDEAPGVH